MSNGLTPLIAKHLSSDYDVLALGIGIGNVEIGIPCKKMTGMDIYKHYLTELHNNNNIGLVHGDVLEARELFGENSFDAVIALDLIEHLEKKDGWKLLKDMEEMAKKVVILYTPIKWDSNEKNTNNKNLWGYGNKYQIHKSLWTVDDFESKGYKNYLEYPNELTPEGIIAVKVIK